MARAVPLILTRPHTAAVYRFRADPLVVDHFSLDVLFTVSCLAGRWASLARCCVAGGQTKLLAALRSGEEDGVAVTVTVYRCTTYRCAVSPEIVVTTRGRFGGDFFTEI